MASFDKLPKETYLLRLVNMTLGFVVNQTHTAGIRGHERHQRRRPVATKPDH